MTNRPRRGNRICVQMNWSGNEWLKNGGNADWVYGYDACKVAP